MNLYSEQSFDESGAPTPLAIHPGRFRRQLAFAAIDPQAGETVTVSGDVEFTKAGSLAAKVRFDYTATLKEDATGRLQWFEVNVTGGFPSGCKPVSARPNFAPTARLNATNFIPANRPGGPDVELLNGVVCQLFDLGVIDSDAIRWNGSISSTSGTVHASMAVISAE